MSFKAGYYSSNHLKGFRSKKASEYEILVCVGDGPLLGQLQTTADRDRWIEQSVSPTVKRSFLLVSLVWLAQPTVLVNIPGTQT